MVDDVHTRSVVRSKDQDVHVGPPPVSVARCDEVVGLHGHEKWFVT
jgi:hypothetical protein